MTQAPTPDLEDWLDAIQHVESRGNPNAVSPKGALGAFQFMPATARRLKINPLDPVEAREGARTYLSELLNRAGGDIKTALAMWNWGMGNVARKGLESMPAETRGFIQRVEAKKAGDQPIQAGAVTQVAAATPPPARAELSGWPPTNMPAVAAASAPPPTSVAPEPSTPAAAALPNLMARMQALQAPKPEPAKVAALLKQSNQMTPFDVLRQKALRQPTIQDLLNDLRRGIEQ